jgi:monothiol glutaredoxin
MKGTRQEPQCGFSRAVCQVLDIHHLKYKDVNVLESNELRQGIKDYSQWPTIPQVYINQEFIGGCDILLQMHQQGELEKLSLSESENNQKDDQKEKN